MIGWKKYFIGFIFFFIVQSIAISLFFESKNREIQDSIKQQQNHFISTYNAIFDTYSNLPKIIFEGRIQNNYLAGLLQNAYETKDVEYKDLLRKELYDQLKNIYKSSLKAEGFEQLQFILQDAESFLRFSMRDKYGENLSSLRYSARKIKQSHTLLEGFESGKYYNGYHYIYPIFLKDTFVGSVDITLDIETYLHFAAKALGGTQRFIMKWSDIHKSSLKTPTNDYIRSCLSSDFVYQKKHNYNIFNILSSINKKEKEQIKKKLALDKPFSIQVQMRKEPHLAIFLPVFTIEHKVGGFIIGIVNASFINDINKSFLKNISFSVASSLLVLFLLFGYYKEKYLLQELVSSKKNLQLQVKERTKELEHSARLLDTILTTLPTPVFYKNLEGKYVICNQAFLKLFNKEEQEVIGKKSQDIFPKEIAKRFLLYDKRAFMKKKTIPCEISLNFDGMNDKHFIIYKNTLLEEGKSLGIIGAIHDITKQKRSQSRIATALTKIKKQQKILEKDHEIIHKYTLYTRMDTHFLITDISDSLCNVLGITRSQALGKRHFELLGHQEKDPTYIATRKALAQGKDYEAQFKIIDKEGNKLWTRTLISSEYDEENKLMGFITFSQDISREKIIEEHSYKDELTGLFNRKKFNEELETAINMFERYKEDTALILFDIDKFKNINDTYGHLIGDKILKELSHIVYKNIRECDTIARWGGEEFTIILPKTNKQQAISIADKLRKTIKEYNFEIKESVTCSFGITTFIQNDTTTSVIKRVDDLLYQAKYDGRDRIIYEE
jgi:diguanylate cyclase (GGDEF)-like protein/PAS domain S-box-containing protein